MLILLLKYLFGNKKIKSTWLKIIFHCNDLLLNSNLTYLIIAVIFRPILNDEVLRYLTYSTPKTLQQKCYLIGSFFESLLRESEIL